MQFRYTEYDFKVIRCGDFTEIYTYPSKRYKKNDEYKYKDEIDFYTFYRENNKVSSSYTDITQNVMDNDLDYNDENETSENVDEDFYTRRLNNVNQTRAKIKRIIYSNCNQYEHTDKFLTLTFAPSDDFSDDGQPTRDEVLYCFKQFKKRFTRLYGDKFEHIAIIERGTQGTERLHLHVVVFNMPYINKKELAEIWQYGFVDIKQVDDQEGAVDYILKYIRKTLEGNFIEKGKKFFFTSRGLKKPEVMYMSVKDLYDYENKNDIGNLLYSYEQTHDFIGKIHYAKYRNTDRFKKEETTKTFASEITTE